MSDRMDRLREDEVVYLMRIAVALEEIRDGIFKLLSERTGFTPDEVQRG